MITIATPTDYLAVLGDTNEEYPSTILFPGLHDGGFKLLAKQGKKLAPKQLAAKESVADDQSI